MTTEVQKKNATNTRWRIDPIYGVFFQTHTDGSLVIEFAQGREDVVYSMFRQALDFQKFSVSPSSTTLAKRVDEAMKKEPPDGPTLTQEENDEKGKKRVAVLGPGGMVIGYELHPADENGE